jgi:hypothetical protein
MKANNDSSSPSQLTSNGLPSASALPKPALEHLDEVVDLVHDLADLHQTDPLALLQLLRTLEQLHREIQQGYFQSALPDSRQSLYALLRDIEENGGWPYIQRWKLQDLFANLAELEQ